MKIPASYHQERLWFIDKFESGNIYETGPIYHNIPLILEIQGPLEIDRWEQAIKAVILRHEALRTRIVTEEDKPFQYIEPGEHFQLAVMDPGWKEGKEPAGAETAENRALHLALETSMKPFAIDGEPLIRGALIRSGENEFLFCLTLHHLISDRYSLEIITREILLGYRALLEKESPRSPGIPGLPAIPFHYADFSQWQRQLPEDALEALLLYWKKYLRPPLPILELSTDYPRAAIHIYEPGTRAFTMPRPLIDKIRSILPPGETDNFVIFLAAFEILLARYANQDDLVVGISKENRHQPGTREIVGPIANLVAIRSALPGEMTFPELAKDLYRQLDEVAKHVDIPFDQLVLELNPEKDMSRTALFDVLFHYEESPLKEKQVGETQIKVIENNRGWGKYDINMLICSGDTGFEGTLVYNTYYFHASTIARLVHHYQVLLESIAAAPAQSLDRLSLLSHQDRHQLLSAWNQTRCDYPRHETMHQLFEKQVTATPGYAAVNCDDTRLTLTYRELEAQANRLANALRTHWKIRDNELVGAMLERSEKMVVVLLGILKAGGAYVPIDPNYPEKRIHYILKDSNCRLLVLGTPKWDDKISRSFSGMLVDVNMRTPGKLPGPGIYQAGKNINKPADAAYVIYTSGTTGYPKGCLVTHQNLVRLFKNHRHPFDFNEHDTWIMAHSFCFDFSVWEMYGALLYGGKLIVPNWETVRDVALFSRAIKKYRVTVLNQTPGAFYNLAAEEKKSEKKTLHNHLRYVCFGGERLEPAYLKEWIEMYPLNEIRLVNMFGITETTVHVTYHTLETSDINSPGGISPIGTPLPETTVYIYDRHLCPVPVGVTGELFVGGSGTARGYLNRVALTADRFIKSPGIKGEIIYKTGDLGRRLYNGTIEYLGRNDDQVKIRGHRIEPGEIERILLGYENISHCVVIAREDAGKNLDLAAYFTADRQVEIDDLRDYMKNFLPAYMTPAYFIQVETFPLTPTGKIDKKALSKARETYKHREGKGYEPPGTQLEKIMVDIWQEVLGIRDLGINDDFFSFGGDSVKGIRVINKIQERMGEIVHVAALFQAPTVKELAAKLNSYKKDNGTKADAARVAQLRRIIKPLAPLPSAVDKNPPAVFILSPYRSGSTLLRIIMQGHPRLFAPPELELLSFNKLRERKAALSGNFLSEGTIRAIKELYGCDAQQAISIMNACEEQDMTCLEFYRLLQNRLGDRILVDKTPSYTFDLEILKRAEIAFDAPKYLHLVRNPYDSIASFQEAKIDQVFQYKNPFTVRELAELLWIISHENILEFLNGIPPERKHILKFEDLVHDPGPVVTRLCDFLGLDYHENMLDVYGEAAERMTDGVHPDSRMIGDVKFFTHSTIDETAADRWKRSYPGWTPGKITHELSRRLGYMNEEWDLSPTVIPPAPPAADYVLSSAQKRLWVLDQLQPQQPAYNLTHADVLEGELNRTAFEKSLETLIKRHESLRTTFTVVNGEPRQVIHDFATLGWKLEYIDTGEGAGHVRENMAKRIVKQEVAAPFHLNQGPLVRTKLVHLHECRHLFLFSLHHIISDGWSMSLLIKEFFILYNAYAAGRDNPLPPLSIQYKDYSVMQNSEPMRRVFQRQAEYWLKEFGGEIPVLNLPTDYPRPEARSFAGGICSFMVNLGESQTLSRVAKQEGVTLFMILLTLYTVFLSRITGQEDIVVGTPIAGRNHPDLEKITGMLVNTLALRSFLTREKTVLELLRQLKKITLKAFDNQDYPFEDLVEKVNTVRDISRNPLFDALFTLRNTFAGAGEAPQSQPGDMRLEAYNPDHITSKFDLSLSAFERTGEIDFTFEYSTELFKEETILRFIRYFKKIFTAVIENPGIRWSTIDILPGDEKKKLLYDFNDTATDYPGEKTISQLFADQVDETPGRIALVGHAEAHEGHNGNCIRAYMSYMSYISYKELNEQSRVLAYSLKEKGVGPDSIVAVMVERSIAMMLGVLGILKAGGAYMPIDPGYPAERVDYMLKDSCTDVIITPQTISSLDIFSQRSYPSYSSNSSSLSHPRLSPAPVTSLAYVIYTSGTTGKPKGVMVTHRNVVRLVKETDYIDIRAGDAILPTGALSFDASTFEIWGALLNGATLVFAGKDRVLDPRQLKSLIRTFHITIMWLTSPLFNQMADMDIDIFAGLRNLLVGGDILSPSHIGRFRDRYPRIVIINGYGPTENTTFSTAFAVDDRYTWRIPIGKPISNSTAYIVDKHGAPQPVGVNGELLLGGDGVARGYLNDPELTAEKFLSINNRHYKSYMSYLSHTSNMSNTSHRYKRFYRTGDLARWQPNGTLEFLGRIDRQVKIRGFRIELGEIEARLLRHESIKEAVVLKKENQKGDKYLCAYYTTGILSPGGKQEASIPGNLELKEFLSGTLPDYMIPAYFIKVEKIPLTPNGKVDRDALPGPEAVFDTGTYTAPRNPIERKLAEIYAEILGIETGDAPQANPPIGIDDNFFERGGHSLNAVKLISAIHGRCNVKIPLVEVFQTPTIRGLSALIQAAPGNIFLSIRHSEEKEYYKLSSVQKRLYAIQQMKMNGIDYNVPFLFNLGGELDKPGMEAAFQKLIQRHESLRTSFSIIEREPVQRVHDEVSFELEYYAAAGENRETGAASIIKNFIRPFELSRAPLLRVGLVKSGPESHVFMLDLHHIITDGISMKILTTEFAALYRHDVLPPMKLQYKDYSEWWNQKEQQQAMKDQEAYWLKKFANNIPILHLPTDYERSGTGSYAGGKFHFKIEKEETRQLKALALKENATLYMVLLSIFTILMAKLSGQDSIVVGSAVAGRRHKNLEQIIGVFINTLPLWNFPKGEKPYEAFLREVRENTLDAFENQDYPFDNLVEKVLVNRNPRRNPVFDVMFGLQNIEKSTAEIPGIHLTPYRDYEFEVAKVDLLMLGEEREENLFFTVSYNTGLFKKETVERYSGYFKRIAAVVLDKPGVKISAIEVMSSSELQELNARIYRDAETIRIEFEI